MSSTTTKRVGAALVIAGAPLLHYAVPGATWIRTSAAIAAGLMLIFFSREAVHDERDADQQGGRHREAAHRESSLETVRWSVGRSRSAVTLSSTLDTRQ